MKNADAVFESLETILERYKQRTLDNAVYVITIGTNGRLSVKPDHSIPVSEPTFAFSPAPLIFDPLDMSVEEAVAFVRNLSKANNALDRMVASQTPDAKALLSNLTDLNERQISYLAHVLSGPREYPNPHLDKVQRDTSTLLATLAIAVKKKNTHLKEGASAMPLKDALQDAAAIEALMSGDEEFHAHSKDYRGKLIAAVRTILERVEQTSAPDPEPTNGAKEAPAEAAQKEAPAQEATSV